MWRQLSTLTRFLQPSIFTQSNRIIQQLPNCLRNFSALSSNTISYASPTPLTPQLLQPTSLIMNFDRGFKVKGKLKLRCKDCYFIHRHERRYVLCKAHPRHKQMSMKRREKTTWILTDATQSPRRAW